MSIRQLPLPLKLQDHAVFESYHSTGNESVVAFLNDTVESQDGPGGWLWGAQSTGKTHLLQAVCERAGNRAQFVPLMGLHETGPGVLDGLENREFVCIDDVDRIARDDEWEFALFALFNALADAGGVVFCAASAAPRECGFRLADLESRYSNLPTFQLKSLDDESRIEALKLRAHHRGLELSSETASFLLSRGRRDMSSLYALLDTLDAEALKAKRRLTIPFVKEVLATIPPD